MQQPPAFFPIAIHRVHPAASDATGGSPRKAMVCPTPGWRRSSDSGETGIVTDLEWIIAWVGEFFTKDPIPTGIVEAPPAAPAFATLAPSTRGQVIPGLVWYSGRPCIHGLTFL